MNLTQGVICKSLLSDVDSGMERDAEAVGAEAGAAELPDNHDVRPLNDMNTSYVRVRMLPCCP